MQYIDNFAGKFLKEEIENHVLYSELSKWNYRSATSASGEYDYQANDFTWIEDYLTEDTMQFIRMIDFNSNELSIFSPLIHNIMQLVNSKIKVERIKVNLLLPTIKKIDNSYHRPHIDHGNPEVKTLLYYINDSDGDTVFFDKTWTGADPGQLKIINRITPKAGSAVLFDSNQYHASSTPTVGVRSVLNVVFYK